MRSEAGTGKIKLGIFDLGLIFPIYFVMQYFFTPACWWLGQNYAQFAWMSDILVFFDIKGVEVFSRQGLWYSVFGLAAFLFGYHGVLDRAAAVQLSSPPKEWIDAKAERLFWAFFLGGFSFKLVKVMLGLDVTSFYIPQSIFGNVYLAFFLSLNWFHTIALAVINVAFQDARSRGDVSAARFRKLAYFANAFIILASLTSSNDTATIFPVLTILIIRQFYRPIPVAKIIWRLLIVVGAIFVIKQSVDYYNQGPDGIAEDGATVMYTLFFVLFYRVNMAHVLAGIVESGRQFYPDGTMAQFWVEMLPIGTAKVNVFDGNEFGRSMGIAAQEDFATGVAVTNMGDFYLNWAFAGIVLGMFLHGLLYKVLVNSCSGRRPTSIMVYGLLFPIILHGVESPISVLYATVLKMAAMCLFVDFMVRQKGRVPTVGGVAVPSGT